MRYLVTLLVLIFTAVPVLAQSNEVNLSVFPAISEYSARPGEQLQKSITVANNTNWPQALSVKARSMIAQGEINKDADLIKYDASTWIELESEEFILAGSEVKTLNINIQIPDEASPGGHYAQIVIKTLNPAKSDGSSVAVVPELASTILITTPGDIEKNLQIDQFVSPSSFTVNQENTVSFIAQNYGNIHEIVRPKIQLYRDGNLVKQVNGTPQLILPGSRHQFDIKFMSDIDMGSYQLAAEISYGDQTSRLEQTIQINPPTWQVILAVAAGSFLLLVAARWRKIPQIISILKGETKVIKGRYHLKEAKQKISDLKKSDVDEVIRSIEAERRIIGLPEKYQKERSRVESEKRKQAVKESVKTDMAKFRNDDSIRQNITLKDGEKTTIIENQHTMIVRNETASEEDGDDEEVKPRSISVKFD